MKRVWLRSGLAILCAGLIAGAALARRAGEDATPASPQAGGQRPMTAAEARGFMKRLARFVYDRHLKKAPGSEQRGMIYEYLDVPRRGRSDQFVQGEALDTMHDGAWVAAALVNAYRATGDGFYKEFLTRWVLPFYCKMLTQSDRLFTTRYNHARPGAAPWGREWALQEGEKGFVPYYWDDGGSVSLERRRDNNPLAIRPSFDRFVLEGKPNPRFLLHGYSLGSSNHMAQDLGVMLQQAWLLLNDSRDPAHRRLAAELAEAAKNLHECRMRHHGHIPMCDAPAALALGDADLMRFIPDGNQPGYWKPGNHYVRALYDFRPGQHMPFPGFADDQQYRYYFSIARHGGELPRPLAFKMIYDAYTEPMLYRYYADDAEVRAGINRFDLHPYFAIDGRLTDYRSDRKGPGGRPRPIGSRMGPQNMVCCGWALQALRAYPGIWEEPYRREFREDLRVYFDDPPPGARNGSVPRARLTLGPASLELVSRRASLELRGECKEEAAAVTIFSRPGAQGSHAVLTLDRNKGVTAVNDQGEALLVDGEVRPVGTGFAFTLHLPYTVSKGQKAWANGIEHGRYSIRAGSETRSFYLASSEEQVKAWLENELAGGLRTWQAIYREKGYIPTGIGTGQFWDQYSDSGGYAHLISAAAQYLLYLDGKADWEFHNVPRLAHRW